MKKLLIIVLFSVTLLAQYGDQDLDGVPDSLDRCPNTPFSDIVDRYGCSIQKLIKPRRYEYYVEFLYAKDSDAIHFQERDLLTSITLYQGNFDLSISAFHFDNNFKKGFSDTSIKAEYRFSPDPMWDLYVGVGVELPTYNFTGNRTDYTFSINNEYFLLGYKFYGGGYYTFVQDRYYDRDLKDSYGAYFGFQRYFRHYSFDLAYLYNHGKFGSITHMAYTKVERYLSHHYYLFFTYSRGLNAQAIDQIYSFGFGRRY